MHAGCGDMCARRNRACVMEGDGGGAISAYETLCAQMCQLSLETLVMRAFGLGLGAKGNGKQMERRCFRCGGRRRIDVSGLDI